MSQSSRPNSLSQVIVLSLLHDGLTPTQASLRFGVSRQWIYQLLARYKVGGLEALEPNDTVDQFGKLSLRRAGKMHHLGVGIEHHFKKVFVVVDHYRVSVVEKKTGEVLSKHEIEPTRTYWTNYLVDEMTKRSRKPK